MLLLLLLFLLLEYKNDLLLVPPQVTLFWCGVIRCNIIKFLQDVLTKWLKIIKNLKSLEFQLCYQWMNLDKQYWIFKSDNKSFFSSVNKFLCSKVPLTCRYSLQKVFFFSQHPSSCIRPPLTLIPTGGGQFAPHFQLPSNCYYNERAGFIRFFYFS